MRLSPHHKHEFAKGGSADPTTPASLFFFPFLTGGELPEEGSEYRKDPAPHTAAFERSGRLTTCTPLPSSPLSLTFLSFHRAKVRVPEHPQEALRLGHAVVLLQREDQLPSRALSESRK